jgi:hypothetical protein
LADLGGGFFGLRSRHRRIRDSGGDGEA